MMCIYRCFTVKIKQYWKCSKNRKSPKSLFRIINRIWLNQKVFYADFNDDKFFGNITFFEAFLPQQILRIFWPMSPPTQGVGDSNSGFRGFFNEKPDAPNILSKFQNFTLSRNKVWNLPLTTSRIFWSKINIFFELYIKRFSVFLRSFLW